MKCRVDRESLRKPIWGKRRRRIEKSKKRREVNSSRKRRAERKKKNGCKEKKSITSQEMSIFGKAKRSC